VSASQSALIAWKIIGKLRTVAPSAEALEWVFYDLNHRSRTIQAALEWPDIHRMIVKALEENDAG
jgi:hypothetical protein